MNIGIQQAESFRYYFEKLVDLKLYQHKFLKRNFIQAQNRLQPLYDSSFLNFQGESWILFLDLESIHIYGQNWSNIQIEEFLERMDPEILHDRLVSGETSLVLEIFRRLNISNYSSLIERNFYRIKEILSAAVDDDRIRAARQEDVPILADYLKQFYHEEYDGQNDKQILDMQNQMTDSVNNNSVFVLLKENDEIASFCTINNPDIGILFTHPNYRGHGYGKKILTYCTHKLWIMNDVSYLMTRRNKIESNSTCSRVGYEVYFQYSSLQVFKNKKY